MANSSKRMTVFSFAIETSTLAALLAEHAVRMDIGVVGGESHIAETHKQTRNGPGQPGLLPPPPHKLSFERFVLNRMRNMPDHIITNKQLAEYAEAQGRSTNFSSQLTTMNKKKLIKSVGRAKWQMTNEGLETLKGHGDEE